MSTATEQPRALVDNAADATQVKNAERIERARARDIDESLRRVLATYEGRHVLWSIIAECGVFTTPPNYSDHGALAFSVGGQNKGRWLIAEIERIDRGAYLRMQQEDHERDTKHG